MTENYLEPRKENIPIYVYVSTFFILYLSSAFSLSVYEGTTRMLLYLALSFYTLVCGYINKRGQGKINYLAIIALMIALFSFAVNGEEIKQTWLLIAYFAITMVFVAYINFDDWARAYVNVMFFCAAFSVVVYFLDLIVPDFIEMFPVTKNALDVETHTLFFTLSPIEGRNMGFFWEPGAFQTFLNIALLLEMVKFRCKNKLHLVVLLIAIVTTFSTAGYVTAIAAVLTYTLIGVVDTKSRRTSSWVFVLAIVAGFVSYYIIENYMGSLYYTLFGKVQSYNQTQNNTSSVGVRMVSIVYPIRIFFLRPLFGIGPTRLTEIFEEVFGHDMFTCTYSNWFAMFGGIYGYIMMLGLYKFTSYFDKRIIIRVLALAVLLLCITGENYALNPSIMILIFYGFFAVIKKEISNENIPNKHL